MTGVRTIERVIGYVLSSQDYGESDRIVTFFSGEKGKLKGIAKGARKSRRRFVNALEPFCLSSILLSRRRAGRLFIIEECDVVNHYAAVRQDIEKTLAASYFAELADLFTVEEKPAKRLFDHMKDFLDLLAASSFSESLVRLYELRLLALSGYDPALDSCTVCGKVLNRGEGGTFVLEDGGVRCSPCRGLVSRGIAISPGTVKTLVTGKTMPLDKIRRLAFTGLALRESDEILTRLIRHILGREPRSLRVYREVILLGNNKRSTS
ncbi:MAG: DNA repair protein RecO [Syntrophales bacterium]|nr:DNA repair protein RecO [Syntrophales bacterium]